MLVFYSSGAKACDSWGCIAVSLQEELVFVWRLIQSNLKWWSVHEEAHLSKQEPAVTKMGHVLD